MAELSLMSLKRFDFSIEFSIIRAKLKSQPLLMTLSFLKIISGCKLSLFLKKRIKTTWDKIGSLKSPILAAWKADSKSKTVFPGSSSSQRFANVSSNSLLSFAAFLFQLLFYFLSFFLLCRNDAAHWKGRPHTSWLCHYLCDLRLISLTLWANFHFLMCETVRIIANLWVTGENEKQI